MGFVRVQELHKQFWLVDKDGLLGTARKNASAAQQPFLRKVRACGCVHTLLCYLCHCGVYKDGLSGTTRAQKRLSRFLREVRVMFSVRTCLCLCECA